MSKEKLYNKLESEVLNADYSSSSLINKAKQVQKEDRNFDLKVSNTMDVIIEKMKHGDSIAYSICYTKYEKELEELEKAIYKTQGKDLVNFIKSHTFLEEDISSSFFDYKVAFIAEQFSATVLGENILTSIDTHEF